MKRIILAALLGLLAITTGSVSAQTRTTKTSPYTLRIHAEKDTYKSGDGILVIVDKTNVSGKTQNLSQSGTPGSWYRMDVRSESGPAEQTEDLKEILHPAAVGPLVDVNNATIAYSLKPGQTAHQNIPLTMYFVMTRPGKYKVTLSEGTDPGQPDNVEVKSNTITITVTE